MISVLFYFIFSKRIYSDTYLYFLIAYTVYAVLLITSALILQSVFTKKVREHLDYINANKYNAKGKGWRIDGCKAGFLICANTLQTAY